MSKTLFELSSAMSELEDELYESGGELTPEMEESLAETREGLVQKADGYGSLIRKFAAMEANCASEIKRMQSIQKVAQNAQKRLKNHILDAMDKFGYDKLEGETTRFTRCRSKSLEVDEETLLAPYAEKIAHMQGEFPDYLTIDVKVGKKAIKDAAKETNTYPAGCSLVENQSLTMK